MTDSNGAKRAVLVDWSPTDSAAASSDLAAAGVDVSHLTIEPRALLASRAGVFVIDLARRPAQGRDVGIWLRRRAATRLVPLVFCGGGAEKAEMVREHLPDSGFCDRALLVECVREGLATPMSSPVVPPSDFAPLAGRPLTGKLGIRPGTVVSTVGAGVSSDQLSKLEPLPDNARLVIASIPAPTLCSASPDRVQSSRSMHVLRDERSASPGSSAGAPCGSSGRRRPPDSRPTSPPASSGVPGWRRGSSTSRSSRMTTSGQVSPSAAAAVFPFHVRGTERERRRITDLGSATQVNCASFGDWPPQRAGRWGGTTTQWAMGAPAG